MNKIISLGLLAVILISKSVFAAPALEVIEFWDARDEQSTQTVDHSQWQNLLNVYLDDQHESGVNRFDYRSVSSDDSDKLDDYLKSVSYTHLTLPTKA